MDFDKLINGGKAIKGNQCYIDVPLDGSIDLFPLKDRGVEEIHFVDGNISQLENVPRGVKKIIINGNKLEHIPRMNDLVHLEANGNQLSHVDLKDMNNLVSLYLNNNKIQRIQNFPPSLKILYISGNKLNHLDLNGANSCTSVNCQDNPMLEQIISGKQFSDPYFKLEKDPHTRIILTNLMGGGGPKSSMDVKSAVENYYKLKKQYEDHKTNVIEKIKSKEISKQKKIKEIRNAQFKCVNCGKEGGTIFKKDNNYLKAICGNKTDPCKLDIKILSSMSLSDNDIRETEAEVNTAKQNIIKLKMDTLFGYITEEETVKYFEKNVEIIKKNSILENTLSNQSFFEIQNESKKINSIKKKMDTVYAELANIRELMNEYNTTKNNRLLKDIASKQKDISDILTVVRSIQYPIHEVIQETVYNRIDDEGNFIDESKAPKITLNVLKQYPYSFDDFFNPNLDLLKVLKYEK
jgi:hypothetical protein